MAEKLLKKRPRKVAPKRAPAEETGRAACPRTAAALVGKYKERQLAWIKRHGVYNYPARDGDEFDAKAFVAIRELWLYADVKGTRHAFEAEFVGKMTKAEFLSANPTYAKLGPSKGKAYYVFKTTPLDYGPRLENPIVIVRTADFGGRSQKVKKAIERFKDDGEFAPLEHYLPTDLAQVPRAQLRVCEAALQMEFLRDFDLSRTSEIVGNVRESGDREARFTCLDFFAGSGLVSVGLSSDFRTVWANDISAKKARVFNANNKEGVLQVCPIENISGKALPAVDLSWGSFPCQDLSLAGDIKGLYASRSGLFWQWLRVMDEMHARPPVVVAENVVGFVSAAGGKYYVAAHEELSKRGYKVGAVMLDAANWLPQSRKRIFMIGVQRDVCIRNLTSNGATWCHPDPVVKVAGMVTDWVWWNIPAPMVKKSKLDELVDFDCPCDPETVQSHNLSLVASEKINQIRNLSRGCRRAFTGYRRTRNHKQVLEVRTDGMAGCLRTPCGGSSRQVIIIATDGELKTRLLTVRETARLMGAPDSYKIPGSYNEGYMAMGDAVAVPVVEYLSKQLLAPLGRSAKERGTV